MVKEISRGGTKLAYNESNRHSIADATTRITGEN